jgi:hypothetical protein
MPFNHARSVSSEVSDSPEIVGGSGRAVGDVPANEALRLRGLWDAVQEYVSQRRAMPEVREGMGEGAESAESAAEIPAIDGGTGGQVDRESGSSIRGREFGNSGGNDDYWNEIRLVRCALRCFAPLVPRGRMVQIVRLPLGPSLVGQLLVA